MSRTFSERLRQLRAATGWTQEELSKKLGVSRNYVGMLENGRDPGDTLIKLFGMLESSVETRSHTPKEDPEPYKFIPQNVHSVPVPLRWVPVISWTHAGEATEYEELPPHWQEEVVPTMCKDPLSFGLIVEGDSMEPHCKAGDRVVVMPNESPRDGCLVVAKLKSNGVVLRRFSRVNDGRVRLIAYNQLYPAVDYVETDFHWIYPVESTIRKEWT